MTLSGNITTISIAFDDIYDAIVAKGVTPSGDITTYATAIGNISSGITPTGTINITTNGTTNVTNYAYANVDVQSGSIGRTDAISCNGTTFTINKDFLNDVYGTALSQDVTFDSTIGNIYYENVSIQGENLDQAFTTVYLYQNSTSLLEFKVGPNIQTPISNYTPIATFSISIQESGWQSVVYFSSVTVHRPAFSWMTGAYSNN